MLVLKLLRVMNLTIYYYYYPRVTIARVGVYTAGYKCMDELYYHKKEEGRYMCWLMKERSYELYSRNNAIIPSLVFSGR